MMNVSSSSVGIDSDSDASSVFDWTSLSSGSSTESASYSDCNDIPLPHGPPPRRPRRSPVPPAPRLPLRRNDGGLSTIDEEKPPNPKLDRSLIDPAADVRSASLKLPAGGEWWEVDLWGGGNDERTRSSSSGGTNSDSGGTGSGGLMVHFIDEDSDESCLIADFPHNHGGYTVCSESICSIADKSEGVADGDDEDEDAAIRRASESARSTNKSESNDAGDVREDNDIDDTIIPRAVCDSKGRCVRHPHVRLRRRTRLRGNKWENSMTACPDCFMEELLRKYAEHGISNGCDDSGHSVVTKGTLHTRGSHGTATTEPGRESGGAPRQLSHGEEGGWSPRTSPRSRSVPLKLHLRTPMNGLRLLKLPSASRFPGRFARTA